MKQRELARHEAELGFSPKSSVRWLVPSELARSAVHVVLAKVFADYADKREMQGVRQQDAIVVDESDGSDDLWVDFVADLGDGFDATYTVASLLAAPELTVATPAGGEVVLPRARLLVMGGDEVYPTASSTAYEDRTTGPYAAALPAGTTTATLLALPGNHDWYDGLTAFLRAFTHGRAIGSWRTAQTRSYFAAKLRPGWWLVGLDSQLGEYIDQPQLDYFHRTVSMQLQPGDAIILCAASPTWERADEDPNAFNTLHYFERNYLRNRWVPDTDELQPTGAFVRLWISGDRHHYARYQEEEPPGAAPADGRESRPTQLVTCGLGGAYLMGAGDTPPRITLPSAASRMRRKDSESDAVSFVRAPEVFPDAAHERRLGWQLANPFSPYWLPRRNPWFSFGMGASHLLIVIVLSWSLSVFVSHPIARAVREADPMTALGVAAFVLGLPLLVVTFNVLAGVRRRGPRRSGARAGLAGAAVQLVVSLLLFELVVVIEWPSSGALMVALAVIATAVGGALVGSEVFAVFVNLAPLGPIGDLRMTGIAFEDGKGFIRMHLTPDGNLEVFPLVADGICVDWTLDRSNPVRVRPVPERGLPRVRLLEEPVLIGRAGYPG